VLALYFVGMLLLGWWSQREAKGSEGFLMGKRQFGVPMMVMHAFGAGTHPGDVAGVMSKTVSNGASGIWVSWMWMFGTPFYWLIGAVVRRMRCLTLADFFEERFGKAATILYVLVATVGMTICAASCLLATTRTVQGMMGKAEVAVEARPEAAQAASQGAPRRAAGVSAEESRGWFLGILLVTTGVFVVYSHWGGIVATIRTDFVQGLMMVLLSFLAIPAALLLPQVGGWSGTVGALREQGGSYLSLFDPKSFSLLTVLLLCINAPFSILAQPHLMTMCGAGRTEWEGRVGFTYGAMLKRVCTLGWCVLALCWLAYLLKTGQRVEPDAAFGDAVRELLSPLLQGVMLACVLAAGMSTGSAIQVTVGALFSQNIYRSHIRPGASDEHYVKVTRLAGLVIIAGALAIAATGESVVRTILIYFKVTATVGIAVALGLLWRRMNAAGVFASVVVAASALLGTTWGIQWKATSLEKQGALAITEVPVGDVGALQQAGQLIAVRVETVGEGKGKVERVKGYCRVEWGPSGARFASFVKHELLEWAGPQFQKLPFDKPRKLPILDRLALTCTEFTTTAAPILFGILAGIVGSLATRPPAAEVIEKFFTKIYVPIGQEAKLALPLDEAVPPARRLVTAGGLFLVKPSRQSWVGFLITLGICGALVGLMLLLLAW
jgi:Na+/proline symporter